VICSSLLVLLDRDSDGHGIIWESIKSGGTVRWLEGSCLAPIGVVGMEGSFGVVIMTIDDLVSAGGVPVMPLSFLGAGGKPWA